MTTNPNKTTITSTWLRRFCSILFIFTFILSIQGLTPRLVSAAPAPLSTALVLVNAQSTNYTDFQHYIQPYLDHFGVPYTLLDISTDAVTTNLNSYGVLIIGHRNLDSGTTRYLDAAEEGLISAAVSAGVGLVNFDNALSANGITGRYAFINDIFTFGYNGVTTATDVIFANPSLNYIIQNHTIGQRITTNPMTVAGITLPGDVIALANSSSIDQATQPFLAVTTYGSGRAVQFGSYNWMSHSVKGPLFGLDGLVWRSIVWAARKPFVMQGMPPFVTMRMDDTSEPDWWIDVANEFGFKPWAGLFTNNIDTAEAAHLSELVNSGNATATIHAFGSGTSAFFYFDHNNAVNFSDEVVASNFADATAWFNANNIPIGDYVVPHYYEFGSNVFGGLNTWGTRYVGTTVTPGQLEYGAPWLQAGPFRQYETGMSYDRDHNFYYADYITIPGHPELDNTFFNCITEIRDITGYEWLGNGRNDVPTAIADGTEWLKLPFDSMAIATLFSHEYTFLETMSPADWRQVLQAITSNIASYNPEYVSMDHACAYARAVHDSSITGGTYDPDNRAMVVNLSGTTDMATRFYVFTEEDGLITHQFVNVPAFSGITTVNYTVPGALDHITITPAAATLIAGTSQQFTATAYDAAGTPIYGLPFTWSASGDGGSISSSGLFTASNSPGTSSTVTASSGGVSGTAAVNVIATTLHHFTFDWINPTQYTGVPFQISIRARDADDYPVVTYSGNATLAISSGTVNPTTVTLANGVWTGFVTVNETGSDLSLNVVAEGGTESGTSNTFDVTTLRACPCSIWEGTGTPTLLNIHDSQPIEVGVKFRTAINGYITGLRFYKGSADTGTHIGHLWAGDGTLLATATFSGESPSGWQEVALSTPVAVTANTTYVASYYSSHNYYNSTGNYFTASANNPPVRALADGEDGPNGVYVYGTGGGFPTQSYQASNYWVDVVFNTTDVDTIPPTVRAVTPINGATNVSPGTVITAVFSEAVNESTVSTSSFTLRAGTETVPATVQYTSATHTATLTPIAPLSLFTVYTATISGVQDTSGNAMAADFTWSFTTQTTPPDEGPGGPILVVSNAANPFSRYYAEILRAEGLNEFSVTDISNVTNAASLSSYDVVILGEASLTQEQAAIYSDWVNSGGHLIAMRPDPDLADLLGLTPVGTSLSEGYLLVNTAAAPGAGIVAETIQYHSSADQYTLVSGTTAVAMLYSNATTPTTYPAVTTRSVGTQGGRASAFTYDLAKSVIYTRQGNPAWAGINGDGNAGPVRADDMFHNGVDPDWVNLDKVAIPQADEQQRLLANLILDMNEDKMPLPRFWYFPRGEKAVVLLTGDDHASGNVAGRLDRYIALSPSGCSVEDWECIRASAYIYPGTILTAEQAASYTAMGFELGVHINTNCLNFTPETLAYDYNSQLAAFTVRFPTLLPQVSERTHCITWSDWASQATVKVPHNIRLDTNYYYWPEAWINNRPGMFTGSGLPMRFANLDGSIIDVYQATTQMTDESGQTYPYTIDTLLSRALGPEGYYGVFTANMHTDALTSAAAEAIIASALANNVPVVSGRQLVAWLDGRNESSFSAMSWADYALTFTVTQAAGANGLQVMLPVNHGNLYLQGIVSGASSVAYTVERIKGIDYALFSAANQTYTAQYGTDTLPPVISNLSAVPGTNGTSAAITWTTNERSNSYLEYGLAADALNQTASDAAMVTAHSLALTGLLPNTTYYYRVSSTDESNNTATSAVLTFTTPMAQIGDDTTADFNAGTLQSCLVDSSIEDGAIRLPAALDETFSTFPTGWTATAWQTAGSASVNDGLLSADGAYARTTATYGPGRSLEFSATFNPVAYQAVGFGSNTNLFGEAPWIILGTGSTGDNVYARVWVPGGSTIDTPVGAGLLGSPHVYRIEWQSNQIRFYVDGSLAHTQAAAISTPMAVAASDYVFNGTPVTVDWLRMSPYASPCTFTSRIFDAGAAVNWQSLAWTAGLPADTGLAVSYRIGNTAAPDSSWSAFTNVAASGNALSGRSRYVQYRLVLTSAAPYLGTPDVQDVTFAYTTGADTTRPVISSRSPAIGEMDVALDSNVVVTFNELLDPATITVFNFYLQRNIDNSLVPAIVSRSAGNVITLDPLNALERGAEFTVTVTTGITDLAGNPMLLTSAWEFSTIPATFIDTTAANFSAGELGGCVVDPSIGDGALRLPATIDESFEGGPGLPTGWSSNTWTTGGTTTLSGGALIVDGASARNDTPLNPGISLEFQATFGAGIFQHIGFGGGDVTFSQAPIAMFSTRGSTNTLYAALFINSVWYEYPIPNSSALIGSSHRYRIAWNTDGSFDFFVDGSDIDLPFTNTITTSMRAAASEYNAGGVALSVDWMQVTPYLSPCTFTSRVIDAGQSVTWDSIAWTGDLPAGTTLAMYYRLGSGEWVPITGASPATLTDVNGRTIQYQVIISTTDPAQTPSLQSVTFNYHVTPTAVELNYFRAARSGDGILLTWETVNEATLAGFNLYRRTADGTFVKINQVVIPPQTGGQPIGSEYFFVDPEAALNELHEYHLEGIETNLRTSTYALTVYWPFSLMLPVIRD